MLRARALYVNEEKCKNTLIYEIIRDISRNNLKHVLPTVIALRETIALNRVQFVAIRKS